MGLFSGKTIYTVDTSSSRVVEDEAITDSLLQAAVKSVVGDLNLSDQIVESVFSSAGFKIDKLARKADEIYPDGRMRSTASFNAGFEAVIKDAIEADVGQSVILGYAVLAPINYVHLTWQVLEEQYGYDRNLNTLGSISVEQGGTAYLKNFVVLVPPDEFERALDTDGTQSFGDSPMHGYTPERLAQSPALREWVDNPPAIAEEDRNDIVARVTYVLEKDGELTTTTIEVPLEAEADSDMEYFQAMYFPSGGGSAGYWTYQYGSGRVPSLDNLYSVSSLDPGNYMPVIYFRQNHTNLAHPSYKESADYKAAKKLLNIIGMDYASMGDAINANPDIGTVRNAYMMFGVSPDTNEPAGLRYLHAFFSNMYDRVGAGDPRVYSYFGRSILAFHFSLRLSPENYLGSNRIGARMLITASGMERRFKAGKVADIGEVARSYDTQNVTYSYQRRDFKRKSDLPTTYTRITVTVGLRVLVLRLQVTDSMYQELRVVRPRLRHQIDGSGRGTNNHLGDPDLLIPVDRELLLGWNQSDKEALYLHSLHFVFNARDKQEVEWYETGFFKFILTAAAIVITIISVGQGAPALAAAFAAGGVYAAAVMVATTIVKVLAITEGIKLIAKEIGPEAAMIAALVTAIYGGYKGFQAGSVQNAPWATELLMASSNLSKASQELFNDQILDVQKEYGELKLEAEEAYKELEEANKLLDTTGIIDPMSYLALQPVTLLGESPTNFYNRTIHSGNIGTAAFDAIHDYVELSLKLPDITDTIREGYTYG